ncbi:hypothetical protein ES702_02216 [subsurface metagenome]
MVEMKVVVVALVKVHSVKDAPLTREEFSEFIKNTRKLYSDLLKTDKVVLFVV